MSKIIFVTNSSLIKSSLINLLQNAKNLAFSALILRENDEYYFKFGPDILNFCKAKNIKFITHSNINFALKNNLENIHFSFYKFSEISRKNPEILVKFKEISVSVHSLDEINFAYKNGANFGIFGNIFETKTHKKREAFGYENFIKLTEISPLKLTAIGGITHQNRHLFKNDVCMMREIYRDLTSFI